MVPMTAGQMIQITTENITKHMVKYVLLVTCVVHPSSVNTRDLGTKDHTCVKNLGKIQLFEYHFFKWKFSNLDLKEC